MTPTKGAPPTGGLKLCYIQRICKTLPGLRSRQPFPPQYTEHREAAFESEAAVPLTMKSPPGFHEYLSSIMEQCAGKHNKKAKTLKSAEDWLEQGVLGLALEVSSLSSLSATSPAPTP